MGLKIASWGAQFGPHRYKLIRRRVIWLIGQWISVKFKSDLRPLLYEVILSLMQDPDLVVRIETATTLKLNILLVPNYLESIFGLLFQLLQQVTECDTKMQVLHVISCVIERVNIQIRPYVGCLVQYLPLLWKQSEDHNMLRCAILTTLIHLVQGLGAESKNLYPFLLPVIQLSTDVSQPPHVYLLEDGLELCWNRGKDCSNVGDFGEQPSHHPGAAQNFPEHAVENSGGMWAIERNLAWHGVAACQNYAESLCRAFCSLLKDITNEGQVQVLKVVEIALKVSPILGAHMFQPLLPPVFRGIVDGERYPVVMSTYLGIMGRILLQNSSFFSSLLTQMASECSQKMDQLLGSVIEMWVDRMDNITQPERRKLSSLALLSLLPSDNSVIQDKFCGIINISVEALHDVMTEDSETGTFKDCMLMSHFEEPKLSDDEEPPTEQDKRKKLLLPDGTADFRQDVVRLTQFAVQSPSCKSPPRHGRSTSQIHRSTVKLALEDPVHSVSLQQFVYEKLKAQQAMMGDQGFGVLMETVDTELCSSFETQSHRRLGVEPILIRQVDGH
ncbi:hypothetical protein FQN60_018457 [Etheostoma spectabile]|uniref:Importin-7/11-like TPR repeats domain-containing protein n=1 Tax=Etheostoma spectabile TaxID=54343 RepID=A0A5J5DI33_9PERO|nr:hypothetical protein FQN60_018457 [Etheostoma spectabile]